MAFNGKIDIFEAIIDGDLAVVQAFLEAGTSVNTRDEKKLTPLMWAARKGSIEMVTLFLEKKAQVNAKDSDHWSALMWACRGGFLEIVHLLLDAKANLHAKDCNGWTPLRIAISTQRHDLIQLLLEKGANPNIKDELGWHVLAISVWQDNLDIVKLLLQHPKTNMTKKEWKNTFIQAANRKKPQLLELFLEAGCSVDDLQPVHKWVFASYLNWRRRSVLLVHRYAENQSPQ